MDTSMQNMNLAIMFSFNNENKLSYWRCLNFREQKELWQNLPEQTRRYLWENFSSEERAIMAKVVS